MSFISARKGGNELSESFEAAAMSCVIQDKHLIRKSDCEEIKRLFIYSARFGMSQHM